MMQTDSLNWQCKEELAGSVNRKRRTEVRDREHEDVDVTSKP